MVLSASVIRTLLSYSMLESLMFLDFF